MCVCFDGRFARHEQANGPTGRGRRMKRRDRFAPQNRPERNPAERPGRNVLARRANRGPGCDAAVRPHGRMRDGPEGRSPLRHAKPSWGGRKALAEVDVQATPLPTIGIACPGIRRDGRILLKTRSLSAGGQNSRTSSCRTPFSQTLFLESALMRKVFQDFQTIFVCWIFSTQSAG